MKEKPSLGNNAIRQGEIGFAKEKEIYCAELKNCGSLPLEIADMRNSLPWPVDMTNLRAHITTYFGDRNYSSPYFMDRHNGIDIQLPLRAPIHSPANATVVMVNSDRINNIRGLADVLLYDWETKLAYWLVHLNAYSIPAHIFDRAAFDRYSNVKVQKGEKLGEVGIFYGDSMIRNGYVGLNSLVNIPADVEQVYGRSYDHLHFEIHYQPNEYEFCSDSNSPVNPVALLERLY